MNKNNGAKLLVDCLVKHGVKYIFGIPGAKIDAVFDALCDTEIQLIVCRHEQNAAFMAAAYGRLTGTPGVVLVTSGPGVSNLATGLLTATTEGDPVIAIGGNVARAMKLKESHQSTDNIKLMEAVTKARAEAVIADTIPEIVENAFRIATMPRSGAVFISLPQDVLHETTTIAAQKPLPPLHLGSASEVDIKETAALLNTAKQPVLLLGAEASRPENTKAIRELLTKHKIATVMTYQAAGVISHELIDCYIGRVGLFKNQPGDKLLDLADLIVTIGYNPVEYDPEIWNAEKNKKIIHIDYTPASIRNNYRPLREVIGDISSTLTHLTPLLTSHNKPLDANVKKLQTDLLEKIASGKKLGGKLMHPLRFIHDLRSMITDDTTIVSDIGTHYMWLSHYFFSYEPRHLLFSNGQQTLGVALPWAMAAKLVRPNSKVISISGDGGFLFSATELETAVREKISFVHCVFCDGKYDMVYQQELLKYHRGSGVDFGYVDIVKFAESFGAAGFRVNHADEFAPLLEKALKIQGPVLIEIPIDYSENKELFLIAHENAMN